MLVYMHKPCQIVVNNKIIYYLQWVVYMGNTLLLDNNVLPI